jgi:diaminohydroxyphosphoribosylaminopyrimidine deaminase/5-amino-6-(5-phosphoribosylamino)uracil reductase
MAETDISDKTWIKRCFDLARRGRGHVSPNPPVGAILVYRNRILAEGYHAYFGGPHAEVEALRQVSDDDRPLIPLSTLYVSLEPCCVSGKTPPCTDLILKERIKDVRISTRDPNPLVSGHGIERLKSGGVQITEGILRDEGLELIRPFTTNILQHRPHIILKWAQSKFGYSGLNDQQVWFSHPDTKVWVHQQRARADAIMVGARAVELDNPLLTTRDYPGLSPHRIIYDPNGRLNETFAVFRDDGRRIYYFSNAANSRLEGSHIVKTQLGDTSDPLRVMLEVLFEQNIGIIFVEGGAYLHSLFIRENLWDEAWVIQTLHPLDHGIPAPAVRGRLLDKFESGTDTVVGILREDE